MVRTRVALIVASLSAAALASCARSSCVQAPSSLVNLADEQRRASAVATDAGARAARPTHQPDPGFLADFSATLRYSLGAPTRMSLSPDGARLYFLRSGPRSFVRDLYVLQAGAPARVLVTAESILRGGEEQLSAEERARRERQRQTGRGITAYELSPDGAKMLIPLSGKLYIVDAQSGAARELPSQQRGAPVDARWSPDGRSISMVRGGELFVQDVASGAERALTTAAGPGISHATAEFVAQEEMDRMEGYWWSGDGQSIAFQETDERAVEQLRVSNPTQPNEEPEVNRYPRAGTNNAVVRLGVVRVTGGRPTWIEWDRQRYPYLARVAWPARGPLTVVVQNRAQTEVVVLTANTTTGATTAMHTERDAAWVNLYPSLPRWLADGRGFLWASERSGHAVLELRSPTGALVRELGAAVKFRGIASVDEAARCVYVTGGEEPSETHVFKISLETGASEQLTRGRGEHEMTFARSGGARAHAIFTLDGPRRWSFEGADGAEIAQVPSVAEEPRNPPTVELVTVGDRAFRAAIVRPRGFVPGARYPVIDAVYGGPGARQVTSARHRYVMNQWLADHGFIVVSIDGRGTPHRGREWERALAGHLRRRSARRPGGAGFGRSGRAIPSWTSSHVGVYGWSFGGYLSGARHAAATVGLVSRCDGGRAGDRLARVRHALHRAVHGLARGRATTAYVPQGSLRDLGRRASSGRCLLVHGTADDNVYFLQRRAALERALPRRAAARVPAAGGASTHIVPDPIINRRLYERIAEFFVTHLQ
jgi:dipeptidyl-peptidase-4